MLVYKSTKSGFSEDVSLDRISDILKAAFRDNHLFGGRESEYNSWRYSLQFMKGVIEDPEIANDVEIAIEYQIPRTSMRVDFMIAGSNSAGDSNVVVVELKQWEKAEKVDDIMLHSVRAFTGGANRIVNHPSYQAFAYALSINNSSIYVQEKGIGIKPCAYLHNCSSSNRKPLDDEIYRIWYDEAPLFDRTQVLKFRDYIKKYVTLRSKDGDLLYNIDKDGAIRPSKALQDCLVSLMDGNEEFILLDDQAVAYDMCRKVMDQCRKDRKKRCIIIQGGPGTGKSVLAINLLKDFIANKELNVSYCTKNRAPRDAYRKLLAKSNLRAEVSIDHLFRSPFGLSNLHENAFDCLIVDETHRLVEKMYGDWNGENQVKECINAALFTVFLIDENQKVTMSDIGSVDEIKKWAGILGARVIMNDETVLHAQFRCNGSEQYIQLVNRILQIGDPVDVDISEMKFDFRVFDDPNKMRDELRILNAENNKARMVAGYCYDWDVKNKRGDFDIYLENGFKAKWNLEGDKIWAINKNSFEQVGCIHTAQGLEFDYVGVLIGKDLRFDKQTRRVITDKTMISRDDNSSGIRRANDKDAKTLIKNTYRTLLTRGQKGCFVYCEDKALSEYIASLVE